MPSQLVEKLLDKNFSEQSLVEFEEDFHPSSEGLWSKAKEIAESKFGFPSSEGLDYAIKWFNLKEGYWITYLTDEELEEFFQMEDDDLTEGTLHHWFKGSKSKDGKPGWVQADGSPCANEKGETKTPKCFSSGRLAALKRKGKKGEGLIKSAVRRKRQEDPGQQSKSGASKPTNVKTFAKGKKDKDYVKAEPKLKKEEVELQEKKDKKGSGSGTKDACYHKVKARYSVWPSAYASGALVKCRKKGAANWGNSTKKEEVQHVDEACWKTHEQRGMKKKGGKMVPNCVPKGSVSEENVDEACWKGYEKKGMKTMFGKRYPNCVKKTKKEEVETVSERDRVLKALEEAKGKKNCGCGKDPCITYGPKKNAHKMPDGTVMPGKSHDESESIDESTRIPSQNGNVYMVVFNWKGRFMVMKVFFPEVKRPSKSQVQDALNKVYPGCVVKRYDMTDIQPGETHLNMGMGEEVVIEDDMKGMSVKSGDKRSVKQGAGLTAKGVAKYRRNNPGSKLKTAVTTPPSKLKPGSKAANRRKSFCARSRGWTGERGKAARRRWNC